MTPSEPPADDLAQSDLDPDELAVHAVIDDEATAEERRRVARDPRLRARLEELRATAAAVSMTPDPPADGALDRIRTAALAALDEDHEASLDDALDEPGAPPPSVPDADPEEDDEASTVISLSPRRSRRSLPPLPVVAAVVAVLMVVGVALIAIGRGGDQSADSATAGDSAAVEESAPAPGDGGGDATSAQEDHATGAANGIPVFAADDDLRIVLQDIDPITLAALRPSEASDSPEATTTAGGGQGGDEGGARCGDVLRASDAAIGPVQAAARTEVDSVEVVVLSTPVAATESAPATTRLTVLEAESCVPRFAVQRDP